MERRRDEEEVGKEKGGGGGWFINNYSTWWLFCVTYSLIGNLHDSTLEYIQFNKCAMFLLGTVPKKHSTVVISETVRETGSTNVLAGEWFWFRLSFM